MNSFKKKISFNDFKKLEFNLTVTQPKNADSKLKPSPFIQIESSNSNIHVSLNEPPTPKTNIEKVVELLNDIVDEFDSKKNKEFSEKASFVLNEILSNKMYNFEKGTTKEHLNFFQLYSSNYDENALSSRREDDLLQEKKVTKKFDEVKLINIKSFGVFFDVFSYADQFGRKNLLRQVMISSLQHKNILNLLKTSYLDDYIEDLRLGYTSEEGAFYHNVRIIIYYLRIFMLLMCFKE